METVRTLAHDVRLAARALARQKTWTTVAILTLALGIGANSALFSIVLVSDRTQEIGIRMALGADRRRVLQLIMRQGSVRLGVGVYDPSTFVASAGTLAAIALLACYLPARRATRVDPMIALRAE